MKEPNICWCLSPLLTCCRVASALNTTVISQLCRSVCTLTAYCDPYWSYTHNCYNITLQLHQFRVKKKILTDSYSTKTNRRFWKLLKRWMKLQRQPQSAWVCLCSFLFSEPSQRLENLLIRAQNHRRKLTNRTSTSVDFLASVGEKQRGQSIYGAEKLDNHLRTIYSSTALKHSFLGIKTKITILLHTVLSWSVKPRPKLTNYSYRNQLRDQKCRNTLPRWFTDVNHNKDKTNILLSSHVSLWGFSACLCTASMKGSHLLLFPSELEMKQAFLFAPQNKTLQVTTAAQKHLLLVAPAQVSICASHLAQRIGPNSTVFLCGSVFLFFFWVVILMENTWKWGLPH